MAQNRNKQFYCACVTFGKWFMIIGWPAIVFIILLYPHRTRRFSFSDDFQSSVFLSLYFIRFIVSAKREETSKNMVPLTTNVILTGSWKGYDLLKVYRLLRKMKQMPHCKGSSLTGKRTMCFHGVSFDGACCYKSCPYTINLSYSYHLPKETITDFPSQAFKYTESV